MIYLFFLTWLASSWGNPLQNQPLVYYTPASTQYAPAQQSLYPFVQYPGFGKALQNFQSPNELLFYPNPSPSQQQVIVNAPLQPVATEPGRFTRPSDQLVNAIYSWFAENNIPLPVEGSINNEASPQKTELPKDQEKIENPDKPPTAGEAEVLAEADRKPNLHYPKPGTPNITPGQRFYILNGQPQFFGSYQQGLPRLAPVPQLLTRNSLPDTQNLLFLQQPDQQPNLKLGNPQSPETLGQNVVFLGNKLQESSPSNVNPEHINPIRYHSQDLKPQNYVLLREAQQPENPQLKEALLGVQQNQQNYPQQQQILLRRLLPQSANQGLFQRLQGQQVSQTPIHQTHYVPVEVVPPQVPVQPGQVYSGTQDQQRIGNQQLSFIQIPVDKNVQPPQYIKAVVPIQFNARTNIPEVPVMPLQNQQQRLSLPEVPNTPVQNQYQRSSPNQVLYLSPTFKQLSNLEYQGIVTEAQKEHDVAQKVEQESGEQQQQINSNIPPGVAALEFARYIASRHGDLYSDTVVIDAKSEDEVKEEETQEGQGEETDSGDVVQADIPEEPSVAQASPGGIALAGPGGVAATAPRGTALAGEKGLAVAAPQATAVAGPREQEKKSKRQ